MKLISDETYARIAHLTWNELAYEYEKISDAIAGAQVFAIELKAERDDIENHWANEVGEKQELLQRQAKILKENEALRELFIDLLAAQGLVTAKREVEIPEELSATLDIGLPLAHRVVDALLTEKETP